MSDVFDAAFGDTPEGSEAAPANPAAQPVPPSGEQAPPSADAPPGAPADPNPAPPAPSGPPEGYVPIGALDDERHKRRNAEQEAERLRAERNPPPQPQAPQIPDPVEDPAGFQAWQDQREASIVWKATTTTSLLHAQQQHGAQTVDEAARAFAQEAQEKPWLVAEMRRQQHPYDWVVARHAREKAFANMTPERIAAFQAWEAAQAAGGQPPAPAPPAAPASPQPKTPIPSINRQPPAGGLKSGDVPVHPGAAFEATFSK